MKGKAKFIIIPTRLILSTLLLKRIFASVLSRRAGFLLELFLFFDIEDADGYKARHDFNFSKRNVTAICRVFLDTIKPLHCGIYVSYSCLQDYIDWRSLCCAVWNAQWSSHDDFKGYMWQFTDKLQIGGKFFDGNILYD